MKKWVGWDALNCFSLIVFVGALGLKLNAMQCSAITFGAIIQLFVVVKYFW